MSQSQNTTRTCDNPSCAGTSPAPAGVLVPTGVTVETITNGVSNRPDINWVVGYFASRSSDNVGLSPQSPPKLFCQLSCIAAYIAAGIAASSAPTQG